MSAVRLCTHVQEDIHTSLLHLHEHLIVLDCCCTSVTTCSGRDIRRTRTGWDRTLLEDNVLDALEHEGGIVGLGHSEAAMRGKRGELGASTALFVGFCGANYGGGRGERGKRSVATEEPGEDHEAHEVRKGLCPMSSLAGETLRT